MRDSEDDVTEDDVTVGGAEDEVETQETERAVATLIAGGLLGAALGAGLGLLASRAVAPAPRPSLRRVVSRGAARGMSRDVTRNVSRSVERNVARTRGELEHFAERVERELRSLRRLVKRQRRRGWLR